MASALQSRPRFAVALGVAGTLVCLVVAALHGTGHVLEPLTALLIAITVVSNVSAAKWGETLAMSGAFLALMLAVAFLDVAAAVLILVVAEVPSWLVDRYRLRVLPINLFSSALPIVFAAWGMGFVASRNGVTFYATLSLVACSTLIFNVTMLAALMGLLDGSKPKSILLEYRGLVPTIAINVALTVAVAAIYIQVGLASIAFMLVAIIAFTYMARLVVLAQERTQQYASLSWGVLSGLLRSLNQRDPRAARHAAAVAVFSRDVAAEAGMSEEDCEVAHTAGLLHDLGGFGLSDRVMERGRTLTDADWQSIRRHPELGADMLRDLGSYGPVAEIVRAHHERIDGRGYPDGLSAAEIPELAKIVAVAEVYDTLTAPDTYRTPMSSFEALTELRRVSGTQLDGRYVEALATVLAGRDVDYRHAFEADFDSELDLERRIHESVDRPGLVATEADEAQADRTRATRPGSVSSKA